MKERTARRRFPLLAVLLLAGSVQAARAPLPRADETPDEQAIAFWVKFDSLPSVGEPTGLVSCRADADGKLAVCFKALPTEITGDYRLVSRERVKAGEWHHVELSYSLMTQRAIFYLDGRFQWENDELVMPHLAKRTEKAPSSDFRGTVKGIRHWPHAQESEAMAVVSFDDDTTLKAVRDAKRKAANLSAVDKAAAEGNKGVSAIAAAIVVPPLTQEPILPYDFPYFGKIGGELRLFACPDEYENASVVLMARKPLRNVRCTVTALKDGKGGEIPASAVDLKLVKRWYRSGSAWIAYHNDRRLRVLCPDLLLNDDSLIYVDETRQRNYLRLDYPEGSVYTDTSDPALNHFSWDPSVPFRDAKTLQPFDIAEAGRNQQLLATVHVPKGTRAGTYTGALRIAAAEGEMSLALAVRVLPFDLPAQPGSYCHPERTYISHMNSFPACEGRTLAERTAFVKTMMQDIRAHNMNHTTGIWNFPSYAKIALETGFIPDRIFGVTGGNPGLWTDFFPGVASTNLTAKDREMGLKAAERRALQTTDYLRKVLPKDAKHYMIALSEAMDYNSLVRRQGEVADAGHALGKRLFAHGMGDGNSQWAGDIQDMNSSTLISTAEASRWHAAGGEIINYADPFPGAENPYWYRRKQGVLMYRTGLDGHMMHGYRQGRTPWNEWGEDWGGDGNYRNFCNCYPMQGGAIMKLCWEGTREGYDDVRYLTKLTQLAQPHLDSDDPDLRREAKRAMLWIEKTDPVYTDLDALKAGTAERIMILQDMLAKRGKEVR